MIDVYTPFAKFNRPDEVIPGEDTGGSGTGDLPSEEEKQ